MFILLIDLVKIFFILLLDFSCQFQDFHEEHAVQAFKKNDSDHSGFISALDFNDVMLSIKNHLLTVPVQNNLVAVSYFSTVNYVIHIKNKAYEFIWIACYKEYIFVTLKDVI